MCSAPGLWQKEPRFPSNVTHTIPVRIFANFQAKSNSRGAIFYYGIEKSYSTNFSEGPVGKV